MLSTCCCLHARKRSDVLFSLVCNVPKENGAENEGKTAKHGRRMCAANESNAAACMNNAEEFGAMFG